LFIRPAEAPAKPQPMPAPDSTATRPEPVALPQRMTGTCVPTALVLGLIDLVLVALAVWLSLASGLSGSVSAPLVSGLLLACGATLGGAAVYLARR